MEDICIGFIGFGLIGGSIAKALKKSKRHIRIVTYNYYKDRPNKHLESAMEDGNIDCIVTSLANGFDQCDFIFLCAPVLTNIAYLKELKPIVKPNCILSDVGSVKGEIHEAARALNLGSQFIGGHPMAGTEKTGYDHSYASLLENAYYVLSPCKETTDLALTRLTSLIRETGALPIVLDPDTHDDVVSAISHVPHIISASLVNLVREQDDSMETMQQLAAGGFKDITRISSSSPIMWQNICLTNSKSILKFLHLYIEKLKTMESMVASHDTAALLSFFQQAKDYRDSIPARSVGLIEKSYELYLDLIDEEGAIATVATILANNHISIKNIGILHNREFEEGVLLLELYNEEGAIRASSVLKNYNYTIYER